MSDSVDMMMNEVKKLVTYEGMTEQQACITSIEELCWEWEEIEGEYAVIVMMGIVGYGDTLWDALRDAWIEIEIADGIEV